VKVMLARLEKVLNDSTSRSQILSQHDRRHHQVVAVFGLIDVDVASGHDMLRDNPRACEGLNASMRRPTCMRETLVSGGARGRDQRVFPGMSREFTIRSANGSFEPAGAVLVAELGRYPQLAVVGAVRVTGGNTLVGFWA